MDEKDHDMNMLTDNTGCGCGCGSHAPAAEPADLPDWAAQPEEALVCPCQGVTKGQVRRAVEQGAYTAPLVAAMTGAGRGTECESRHPAGRSCLPDVEELIRLYQTEPPPLPQGGGCC
jgi:NAD(P)H-nitrite reductase large subunit